MGQDGNSMPNSPAQRKRGFWEIEPKRRSWILVFSRKERKDRKVYYNWLCISNYPNLASVFSFHQLGELPYRINGMYNQ
jgi:hypothetical protein